MTGRTVDSKKIMGGSHHHRGVLRGGATFRGRILLLGLLAGLLPSLSVILALEFFSHSLQRELSPALQDLQVEVGQRVHQQVHQILEEQLRVWVHHTAGHLRAFLAPHPPERWPAVLQDPALKEQLLHPGDQVEEIFLVDTRNRHILFHSRRVVEGGSREGGLIPAGGEALLPSALEEAGLSGSEWRNLLPSSPEDRLAVAVTISPARPGEPPLTLVAVSHGQATHQLVEPAREGVTRALKQSQTLFFSGLQQMKLSLGLVLLGLALAAMASALMLARRLTAGLTQLTEAAEAFNRGDLDYRVELAGEDELARLGRTLNRMVAGLKENTVSRVVWENTFNSIPDLILVMDGDHRLTRINQAAARHLGLTPEEAVGRLFSEVMPDLEEAPLCLLSPPRPEAPSPGPHEFYWQHRGRTFLATVTLLQDTQGKFSGAVLVARDITAFQQMQRDLTQTTHFLNQIIEAAPLAMSVVNAQGLFTHVNPQVAVEFGYSPEELLDRHFSILYANESELQKVLTELREKGEVINRQVEFLHRNGQRVPARLSIRKLYDENGQVAGSVALSSNISEEISLQRQLEVAQQQEIVATLAGGLAHNFNNLLMIIIGLTTLMLSKITPDHPFYTDLKEIERQVKAGREITRKLLSFRRGGRDEFKPIDLNNLVEFTTDMFARTRRELTVIKDLAPQLPAVEADPGQLQQVIMNLLINAWQAMPQGGTITVRTGVEELRRWDEPHFSPEPGLYVVLGVEDTGIGMDQETMRHLFEPFFTTKEPGQGSGLGLASAHRIIKNHRGAIRVHSTPGKGSLFEILLPASAAKAQVLPTPEMEIITGRGTILVVDDEPLLRKVAAKLLQKLGYQVLEAPDGESAIALFREKGAQIDLVLLDMIMPGMDGHQTLERLRALNPTIPVLMCSGYSEEENLRLPAGVSFLPKPYPLETLSQQVSAALRRRLH
ncbi:MAG: PAS domain S-box protein [Desulfobaccales bacterium]